jgi:hypothetical protein
MARTWNSYFDPIKTKLGARQATFEKIFDHLDDQEHPVIIETGTYREENNYTGDGCSTLLFDNYIDIRGEGTLISIDIDPAACSLAEKHWIVCMGNVPFFTWTPTTSLIGTTIGHRQPTTSKNCLQQKNSSSLAP